MNKELSNIIKNLSGNVLGIGIDDKLSDLINKNANIKECNLLNSFSRKKLKGKKTRKTIKIKKIRKVFKKKKVDYIICDYEEIEKYLNSFVKDSIYINKSKLYFFGNINKEILIKKYNRYDTKVIIKEYKNSLIVEIDNSSAKTNFFKDRYYMLIDWFSKAIEVIGDILMG